jgi:hypothetical protein
MAPSANRKRTILALVLAGSLAGAAVALPALAAPVKKIFTAGISPGTPQGAGLSVIYTYTITNDISSSQTLGSANVAVPSGFTVTSANPQQVTAPAGKSWTANVVGSSIQLRSGSSANALAANQSVSVTFTATDPCAVGSYTWTAQVKQSNDFLGTNNDFTLKPSTSFPSVQISATSAQNIQFTAQPQDTVVNGSINGGSSVSKGSGGVKVKATDSCANPVQGASVSMAISTFGDSAANLTGNSPQTTGADGVATFSGLKIDRSSSGYALRASVGGSWVDSQSFDIVSALVACAGGTCTASADSPTTDSSITVDAGGGTGTLELIYESQPLACGGEISNPVGGLTTIEPPAGATLPVVATFDDTIHADADHHLRDSYPVCKTVEQGGVTTTEIVPFCSDISNGLDRYPADPNALEPCIQEQEIELHGSQPPTLHTVMLMTSTDPRTLH